MFERRLIEQLSGICSDHVVLLPDVSLEMINEILKKM